METPLAAEPVHIYWKGYSYLVDASDERNVYALLQRKDDGLLPQVVGDFAAVMYLLIQDRPRHDTEIFAHLNGDVLDFTRANLHPTTRRKHSPPQLAQGRIAGLHHPPQQGVVKNNERFRVYFRAHGTLISLGYYHSRAVAEQVYAAYRAGTLRLARIHAREVASGKTKLSRRSKGKLLKELRLTDPVPRPGPQADDAPPPPPTP